MGLGRKTSTHLSNSCSGAAAMSGASFRCFLGASQKGVVTVREWSLKDEAGKHHWAPPPVSPASTPVLFQLLAPDCTSLTWTRLLRTVLKYLQLRKEALCQPFRLSLGICSTPPSLPTMRSSPPASSSVTHSSIHPPYRWGHLPWLSWRHLSCFDFLSWQHRAVLFLACRGWEDWEMALRPSALLCCGSAVAAAVWPPRFIHAFFSYF